MVFYVRTNDSIGFELNKVLTIKASSVQQRRGSVGRAIQPERGRCHRRLCAGDRDGFSNPACLTEFCPARLVPVP
jgi:hypothetical protein